MKDSAYKKVGRLFRIEWGNPYTQPPDGAPCVLAEIFVPHEPGRYTPAPPELLGVPHTLGGGYSLVSRHVSPPPRELPPESLARVRRKRLARRVTAKVPMFADHFIDAELARKPNYYDGITDPQIEERKKSQIESEWETWLELWSRPNLLVIYGQEPEACRLKAEELRRETQAIREKSNRVRP